MHFTAWRALGVCTSGVWIYLAFFRGGFWKLRERLVPSDTRSHRSVTAIIPARDEREFIGRAVASLHAQQIRVVVADDESSDGTGEVSGADLVVRVGPRAPGWKGKLWAVASGIRADASGAEFLLLTDADIEHVSPDIVNSLLAQADRGFDLVSVMVQLRCESVGEQLLIPAFVFFFFKLYPPGTAAAAGGCMLIRREMLERIGGIESIRSALIDDCALAARVHKCGGRVWLGISELPIRSMRPYGGISGIRAMISRSAFAQLKHSGLLLAGTVLAMFVTYLAPPVLLLSRDLPAEACGFFAWLLGAALYLRTVRHYRASTWTAFCLPLIGAFYLWATVESAVLYRTGRGGMWKGRVQDS